jgi:hypothetical protein
MDKISETSGKRNESTLSGPRLGRTPLTTKGLRIQVRGLYEYMTRLDPTLAGQVLYSFADVSLTRTGSPRKKGQGTHGIGYSMNYHSISVTLQKSPSQALAQSQFTLAEVYA